MTEVARSDPARVVREVRDGRWVTVAQGPDRLVVGTPATLLRTKVAYLTGGASAGVGVAVVATGLAVVAGWVLLALGLLVLLGKARTELRARATYAQRERNERGRAAALVRDCDGDDSTPVLEPAPHGPAWGAAARSQQALSQRDRALPPGTRRALT